MSWLLILAGAKRVGTSVITWLSHRSFWQLVSMGLCALCLLLAYQRDDARHDAVNYSRQRDELKRQLDAISTRRNEQKIQTQTRIVSVQRIIHDADARAKTVENAPLPGGCRTPDPILGADL